MKYFKNSELVKLYNVSDKAVRNWIQATQTGKLNLDLFELETRVFIADTIHNDLLLAELVERGKKYRNHRNHVTLKPSTVFYSLFNQKQIINIINSLEKHHEFPQQYRYLGEGAAYWNEYLNKLHTAGKDNLLTTTLDLLKFDQGYLEALLNPFDCINVVDLGVGNGLASRGLLDHFKKKGKLGRYIGIDISRDLLDITRRNIHEWFDGEIRTEMHIRDLNHEQFADVLRLATHSHLRTVNLLLLTGGIIGNFRRPEQALNTIRDSMNKDDILLTSLKLDTENTRRFFDFNIQSDKTALSVRNILPLDYLSITSSYYEVEQFFDESRVSRFIQIKLKIDISIDFEMEGFKKTLEFRKGDSIKLFRSREYTDRSLIQLYDDNELAQLRTTLSHNRECVLLTCRLKDSKQL